MILDAFKLLRAFFRSRLIDPDKVEIHFVCEDRETASRLGYTIGNELRADTGCGIPFNAIEGHLHGVRFEVHHR